MTIPAEYNPYRMMADLLLVEAVEIDADQILLISRCQKTNLYFVSGNRVKKMVPFQADCISSLLDQFYKMRSVRIPTGDQNLQLHLRLSGSNSYGCVSLSIERPQPDVDT